MSSLSTPTRRNATHNARQYNKSEWGAKRPLIKRYYIDEDMTLPEVSKIMSAEHDFHPTRRMYITRLGAWKLYKNCTEERVLSLANQNGHRDAASGLSKLSVEGRTVDTHRIDNYLKRKKKRVDQLITTEDAKKTSDLKTDLQFQMLDDLPNSDSSSSSTSLQDTASLDPSKNRAYDPNCPYRSELKRFRIIEKLPNGSTYEVDSVGRKSYLASDEQRPCTELCHCRQHVLSRDFAFLVHKTPEDMHITIYSEDLYAYLIASPFAEDFQLDCKDQERTLNAFVLLKHYDELKRRIEILRSEILATPADQALLSEMELLVQNLLGDGEVFKSFGYESLYERGFINFNLWTKFQKDCFESDVAVLNQGFCEVDDDDESEDFISSKGEDTDIHDEIDEDHEGSEALKDCQSHSSSRNYLTGPTVNPTEGSEDHIEQSASAMPQPQRTTQISLNSSILCDLPPQDAVGLAQPASDSDVYSDETCVSQFALDEAAKAGNTRRVLSLLDRGADIDGNSGSCNCPLAQAAGAGHEEIVRLLLDRGANIDGNSGSYNCLITKVARTGHEEILWLLLDRGADIDGNSGISNCPLARAAEAGHDEIVRLLLDRGADIDGNSGLLNYPLARAAEAGHDEIVRLLLDRGADIDGNSGFYNCPLARAAGAGHDEIVQLLLDRGADIEGNSRSFNCPLTQAARAGHEEIVQLLLDRGADIEGNSRSFNCPLTQAAGAGHEEILKLLLDRGALRTIESLKVISEVVKNVKNGGFGHTVKDYAMVANAALGSITAVDSFLNSGMDINITTSYGTALSAAAIMDEGRMMRWLLRRGANVDSALSILRSSDDTRHKVGGLLRVVYSERIHLSFGRPDRLNCDTKRRQKFRILRRHFLDQHARMKNAAQDSSTKFGELSLEFQNHRDTWDAGVKTLLGLGRGERPTVANTIAFLCLAKATSDTLSSASDQNYVEPFFKDLPRWQSIFTEEEDRDAYRDAVESMWWIVLDEIPPTDGSYDKNLLKSFCSLASILASQASSTFGLHDLSQRSFGSNREAWILRNSQNSSDADVSNDIPPLPDSGGSSVLEPDIPHTEPPDPDPGPPPKSLTEDVDVNTVVADHFVCLLMFGAIFAIMLIFLQWVRNVCAGSFWILPMAVSITTLEDRYWNLQLYMGVTPSIVEHEEYQNAMDVDAECFDFEF